MISTDLRIPNDQIQYGQKLGEGGFGAVYKATWLHTDVAVKKLLINLSGDVIKDFENEIKIHSKLRNPHVVQIFGVLTDPHGIVMEYMSRGSLRSVLEKNIRTEFSWDNRKKIAIDICAGLFFLHQQKVIHRDLKSLNVLLDESYRAKLADFGLAKVKSEITTCLSSQTGTTKGTTQWMAPEIFMSLNPEYNTKTDVFSFAVVLWELASHEYPYKNANPFAVPTLIMQGLRETFPSGTPEAYEKLAIKCWDKTPDNRPTVDQAINSLKAMVIGSSDEKKALQSTASTNNSNSNNNSSPYLANTNHAMPQPYLPNTNLVTSQSHYLPNTNNSNSQSLHSHSSSGSRHKSHKEKHKEKKTSKPTSSVSQSSPSNEIKLLGEKIAEPKPVPQKPVIKSIDPLSLKKIKVLEGHSSMVDLLIQLSDGTLASGSLDKTIKLWDPEKGKCLKTQEHSALISSLIQLQDGTLASGYHDNTIKLWDPKTGKCLNTLERHSKCVHVLIQLSDGTLASGSHDKTIKLWAPKTGNYLKTLKGSVNSANSLIQLSDGTLASGDHKNTIKLWDVKTGSCLKTLKGHSKSIFSLIQLSNGRLVSGAGDNTIKLWDLQTGNCLNTLKGHFDAVSSFFQLSDGALASGSWDRTVKLWDVKTEICLNTLEHFGTINSLIQLKDETLAVGYDDSRDGLKLWEPKTGKCLNTLGGDSSYGVHALIQLSNGTLAGGFGDHNIKIYG